MRIEIERSLYETLKKSGGIKVDMEAKYYMVVPSSHRPKSTKGKMSPLTNVVISPKFESRLKQIKRESLRSAAITASAILGDTYMARGELADRLCEVQVFNKATCSGQVSRLLELGVLEVVK